MMKLHSNAKERTDRKEMDHRFREAEKISKEYPFSPEDVYYTFKHFGWDKENTETILILASTHGVSPFDMIRMINDVNRSEDTTGAVAKPEKKHIKIQQMKLRGLSGYNRDGLLFLFSYQYHLKDYSFNVFINIENARKLCRAMFGLEDIEVVRNSPKWEFFLVAIVKEVFRICSRYPMEIILTLDEYEVKGDYIKDIKSLKWKYDGENEIELTKPDKINFNI